MTASSRAENELLGEEKTKELKGAMDELPEAQREILWLHKYEELSYSEIGDLRNETEEAVKQMAYRAYRNLRETLPDWLTPEENQ